MLENFRANVFKLREVSLVKSMVTYKALMFTTLDVGTTNFTHHDIWKSCITRLVQPEEDNNRKGNG